MFVSNKDLATAFGGVAGGMIGYSLGGSPEVVCVAAIIGAIAARSMFTNRSIVEADFESFYLGDVEKFKSLGDIDNVSMFAHRHFVLSKQKLCLYLRNMDQEEYDYMKNEHEIATNATSLKKPILIGSGVSGFFLYVSPFIIEMLVVGLIGSFCIGKGVYVLSEQDAKIDIEKNRVSRLEDKIKRLSERISSLIDRPKEKHQLQLARGYFSRAMLAYVNTTEVVHYHHYNKN